MFTLKATKNPDKYIVEVNGEAVGHVIFNDYLEVWNHNADLFKSEYSSASAAAEALVKYSEK